MKLSLQQADHFWDDLACGVDWYRDRATPEVAERFVDAIEATLAGLLRTPEQGRLRFKNWPELAGIRSFRVQRPFDQWLIFLSLRCVRLVRRAARSWDSRSAPETAPIALT